MVPLSRSCKIVFFLTSVPSFTLTIHLVQTETKMFLSCLSPSSFVGVWRMSQSVSRLTDL